LTRRSHSIAKSGEKRRFSWQARQQNASGNAGCPAIKIKDRDITTLKVLQIETIKTTTFHLESCI
jgi:hypothetical protein